MKKKKQLSSFDILVLSNELREMLVGSFIYKVYQPTRHDLIIRCNVPVNDLVDSGDNKESKRTKSVTGPRYRQINLTIKVGKYIYAEEKDKHSKVLVSTDSATTSDAPPGSFAMLLRKHLRNAKITDISQHEFDRIINIVSENSEKLKIEV